MKDIKKILFLIQARTQSTRISRKMIREFDGNDSLVDIAIKKIKSSDIIPPENFWLSILDNELIDIAKKHNVKYYWRSEESTREPISLKSIFEWHSYFLAKGYEYYININGCSPLLTTKTIENFTKRFIETKSKGLFGVREIKNFIYDKNGVMLNKFNGERDYKIVLETKMLEPLHESGNVLYGGLLEDISKNIYMGTFSKPNDPEFFIVPNEEFLDIDEMWEWNRAKILYENLQK